MNWHGIALLDVPKCQLLRNQLGLQWKEKTCTLNSSSAGNVPTTGCTGSGQRISRIIFHGSSSVQ